MPRLALLVVLILVVPGAPASAATRVSWPTRTGEIPPFWADYMRIIGISGDDGVNHDIVVKPSGAQQLNGFPQKVDIYDYADTVVNGSGNPCHVISTHHAQCVASGGLHNPSDQFSYTSWAEVD